MSQPPSTASRSSSPSRTSRISSPALRVLDQEARTPAAVDAAERSLALANNRYRGGVASYLEVITAQSAALTNERAAVACSRAVWRRASC